MSTATQEPQAPSSYEPRVSSWRIAEGFFKKGQDDGPNFQKKNSVFGKFTACGLATFVDEKSGESIERLWVQLENNDEGKFRAVSYTHLTLPTIYSV